MAKFRNPALAGDTRAVFAFVGEIDINPDGSFEVEHAELIKQLRAASPLFSEIIEALKPEPKSKPPKSEAKAKVKVEAEPEAEVKAEVEAKPDAEVEEKAPEPKAPATDQDKK